MLSSALLLYFPGGLTTRCRRNERSTNARRNQAVRWMQTFTQVRVFFRMSMRGVSVNFTSAWRVWWRQKDLLKGNFEGETQDWEFLCWSLSGRLLLPSLGARSRSIGRGRAVENVNNETIVACLTRSFTARPRSRLKAPLPCCSRADKHTHDVVVLPCTCSRWLDRSAKLKIGWRRVSCKLAKTRKGSEQCQWTKSVFIESLGTKDVKTCCAKKMDLHSPRNKYIRPPFYLKTWGVGWKSTENEHGLLCAASSGNRCMPEEERKKKLTKKLTSSFPQTAIKK